MQSPVIQSITRNPSQNPRIISLFSISPFSLPAPPQRLHFHLPTFPRKASKFLLSQSYQPNPIVQEDEEDHVVGDCLVFEEGIFQDPYLQETQYPQTNQESNNKNSSTEIEPENLIPEEWLEVQKEVNITKKERRRLAQQLEFGRRVEKRRLELRPIAESNGNVKLERLEEYEKYRDEKLKQLKPLKLDNPAVFPEKQDSRNDDNEKKSEDLSSTGGRVAPRNPRLAVYGGGLESIKEFFNSGNYDPDAAKKAEGPRKLFTKEEKLLLNRRMPDLTAATSGKWKPLHTLAASGEFYLVNSLLKHNVDINATDKNGGTAIHKAILGKKQAIFNYLLRESANPHIRDKEGATLMHYAVRTASSPMIKILLLYNVDINFQDNDGWTPLHLAVQSRRTDIVKLLLVKGADKTLRNRDGLTPFDLCLYFGRDTRTFELIKMLIELPRPR